MGLSRQKLWTTCRSCNHPSRSRVRIGLVMGIIGLLVTLSGGVSSAIAATYYIGSFSGSSPSDTSSCGTRTNPCATLAYWTQNRQGSLANGDVVRIAAGTYGPSSSATHCIVARQGVMYEGRNADDTAAASAAVVTINGSQTPNSGNCQGSPLNGQVSSMGNFAVQNITFRGATNGGNCMWLNPSTTSTNVSFTNVRFTGCGSASFGWIIGDTACPSPGATCRRNMQNLTLTNAEVDNNIGDGLYIGAVDTYTVSNSSFHNNGARFCTDTSVHADCTGTYTCDSTNDNCTDNDGLNHTAGKNGTITDSQAYRNSQYGFDFTRTGNYDMCDGSSRDVVVDRTYAYDNGLAAYSFSGCTNNITVRNSFAWGRGTGLNLYYGACGLKFHNNTIYMDSGRALFSFSLHTELDMRNNVFATANSSSVLALTTGIVQQNNGSVWDGNAVVNRGTGNAISIFDPSPNTYSEMSNDPDYACVRLSTPQGNGQIYANSAAGLSSWKSAGYFGSTTAANDRWGTTPAFVNAAGPSVTNLHLSENDTIAKDRGVSLTSFSQDYDRGPRPQGLAWDIGAHEFGLDNLLPAPTNLHIVP